MTGATIVVELGVLIVSKVDVVLCGNVSARHDPNR